MTAVIYNQETDMLNIWEKLKFNYALLIRNCSRQGKKFLQDFVCVGGVYMCEREEQISSQVEYACVISYSERGSRRGSFHAV